LRGDAGEQPVREFTIHHSGQGVFALRQGAWKAIFHLGSGGFTQPANEEPQPGGPTGQLYHLGDDPQERRNRWLEEPETVQRLTTLLERAKTSGRTRP
jgi:arylsulfatase A-like enzyme